MNQLNASVGIIIPARNEESAISLVVQNIPPELNAVIVIIDNASTDNTASIARKSGAVVLHEKKSGYGRVMLRGIDYFRIRPVDIVVFLDGDYSDYPQEMTRLVEPLIFDGYDMVVSTRLNPLYDKRSLPFHVVWGNRLVVLIMNHLFGTAYTDLGPFRAIRYDSLLNLDMGDLNYGWTVEMQAKAKLAGLRVKEVPVHYRQRIGESKISGTIKGSVLAGSKMLYMLFKLRLYPGSAFTRRHD